VEYSGKKRGFVLKRRPRAYPPTPQQKLFREAIDFCEIKRGIPKYQLMLKLKNCIPNFYKERGRCQLESTQQSTASPVTK